MKYEKSRSTKTIGDFILSDFSKLFDPHFHEKIKNSFKHLLPVL